MPVPDELMRINTFIGGSLVLGVRKWWHHKQAKSNSYTKLHTCKIKVWCELMHVNTLFYVDEEEWNFIPCKLDIFNHLYASWKHYLSKSCTHEWAASPSWKCKFQKHTVAIKSIEVFPFTANLIFFLYILYSSYCKIITYKMYFMVKGGLQFQSKPKQYW